MIPHELNKPRRISAAFTSVKILPNSLAGSKNFNFCNSAGQSFAFLLWPLRKAWRLNWVMLPWRSFLQILQRECNLPVTEKKMKNSPMIEQIVISFWSLKIIFSFLSQIYFCSGTLIWMISRNFCVKELVFSKPRWNFTRILVHTPWY